MDEREQERTTASGREAEPELSPEAALRHARTAALTRHARAVDAIFAAEERGGQAAPELRRELSQARKAFEAVRPHSWRDAEAAYVEHPGLAGEAASGRINRAIRALQLESEIRTDPNLRADRFVQRWQGLDRLSQQQYERGEVAAYQQT